MLDPVDQGLLVARLALGFELRDRLGREALREIAVGEVESRIITRMGARHGGEVDAGQVEPESLIDLVEEVERADLRRDEPMELRARSAMSSAVRFSAGAIML